MVGDEKGQPEYPLAELLVLGEMFSVKSGFPVTENWACTEFPSELALPRTAFICASNDASWESVNPALLLI
jgi:hypothetical protein